MLAHLEPKRTEKAKVLRCVTAKGFRIASSAGLLFVGTSSESRRRGCTCDGGIPRAEGGGPRGRCTFYSLSLGSVLLPFCYPVFPLFLWSHQSGATVGVSGGTTPNFPPAVRTVFLEDIIHRVHWCPLGPLVNNLHVCACRGLLLRQGFGGVMFSGPLVCLFVCLFVCLSVCLSVSNITEKVMDRFR